MVPTVGPSPGEQETKPTQHSVKELRSLGLTPDFIVCRSKEEVRAICIYALYVYTLCSKEEVSTRCICTHTHTEMCEHESRIVMYVRIEKFTVGTRVLWRDL